MWGIVDNTHKDFTNPPPTLVPLLSASEEGRARSRRGPNHPYETQVETSYPKAYRSLEAIASTIRAPNRVVVCRGIGLGIKYYTEHGLAGRIPPDVTAVKSEDQQGKGLKVN